LPEEIPNIEFIIALAGVQGEDAPLSIARAIANCTGPNLMLMS
jgi:exonuclease VII large subunit